MFRKDIVLLLTFQMLALVEADYSIVSTDFSLPCSVNASGDMAPFVAGGIVIYPGEFPWVVNIQLRLDHNTTYLLCGGSLIDRDIVITAAHCLYSISTNELLNLDRLIVVAGDYNILCRDRTEQFANVVETKVHESFNIKETQRYKHDIALLKLSYQLKITNYVEPITLPSYNLLNSFKLSSGVVAGWGSVQHNGSQEEYSPILRKAEIPFASSKNCSIENSDLQICAGGNRSDACSGDSGGPLMCTRGSTAYLCGIVSYGLDNTCGIIPGVYTNVFGYSNWIQDNRAFVSQHGCTLAWVLFSLILATLLGLLAIIFWKKWRKNSLQGNVDGADNLGSSNGLLQ